MGCLWLGWLTTGVTVPLLATWARARKLPSWLWAPPAVAVLNFGPAPLSRALAMRLWPIVRRVGWLEWCGQSLLVSALATAGVLWTLRPRTIAAPPRPSTASTDPRDRLPRHLGRTVLCLQMEDHYVRVHTPDGSALVLTSLSQAIAGLGDREGAQTRRSWWVARGAVAGVVEDGRNMRLTLVNGLEAPISRARLGALRAEGWLARDRHE